MEDFSLVREAWLYRIRKELEPPANEFAPGDNYNTQERLVQWQMERLKETVDKVEAATTAEEVWIASTKGLGDLSSQRFLVENLLEAVKRGESLLNTVLDYEQAGLLTRPAGLQGIVANFRETTQSPFPSWRGAGRVLRGLLTKVVRVSVKVFELAVAALRELGPEVVASVTPGIGFAGPVPTFQVEFDLSISATLSRRLFEGMEAMAGSD